MHGGARGVPTCILCCFNVAMHAPAQIDAFADPDGGWDPDGGLDDDILDASWDGEALDELDA